jgi:hypothetical protein
MSIKRGKLADWHVATPFTQTVVEYTLSSTFQHSWLLDTFVSGKSAFLYISLSIGFTLWSEACRVAKSLRLALTHP